MGKSKNEKPRNEVSQAKENIGHNLFIFAFSNMFKTKILWPVVLKKRMKIELYLIAIFNYFQLFTFNLYLKLLMAIYLHNRMSTLTVRLVAFRKLTKITALRASAAKLQRFLPQSRAFLRASRTTTHLKLNQIISIKLFKRISSGRFSLSSYHTPWLLYKLLSPRKESGRKKQNLWTRDPWHQREDLVDGYTSFG